MKHVFTLLTFLPLAAFGQITFDVEAGGSTAPGAAELPYYDPMDIAIHVGDVVHWTGVSGTHNVYGGLDDFPDNPEGFSSGEPVQDLDYSRTFTVPGLYEYHCTQQGHDATQHGTILVQVNQSVEERTELGALVMFPVPADAQLTVDLKGNDLRQADVMSVDGRVVRSVRINNLQRAVIDLEGLATGRYLLRLTSGDGRNLVRPFMKS
jgi:plastocyanin